MHIRQKYRRKELESQLSLFRNLNNLVNISLQMFQSLIQLNLRRKHNLLIMHKFHRCNPLASSDKMNMDYTKNQQQEDNISNSLESILEAEVLVPE